MKIHFSFLWLVLVIFGSIWVISSLRLMPVYDLTISEHTAFASDQGDFSAQFSSPKNTWYVGIEKSLLAHEEGLHTEDICVRFSVDNATYAECLDVDDVDETAEMYSFPLVTAPSREVRLTLFSTEGHTARVIEKISRVTVYALNTEAQGQRITWSSPGAQAHTAVVPRALWGADESLRYTDHPRQKAAYEKNLAYFARPKTEKELASIRHTENMNAFLKKQHGDAFATTSLRRTENGHRLVWPIQKVKRVNRIVVHHTAESLEKNLPDEQLIRAIYAYHAVTRGWGDIGYNYIVGQNGKIYEGRAGGDYVVGAHASYNNIGSVGISVLGDYEKNLLNEHQQAGIKAAISMAAQKYGITLTDLVPGYKRCNTKACYPLQVVRTRALLGHRDVGVTSCPGKHLYSLIPDYISELNRPYLPVLNSEVGVIEPKPREEVMNMELHQEWTGSQAPVPLFSSPNAPSQAPGVSAPSIATPMPSTPIQSPSESEKDALSRIRYIGKKFRVRLSYPENQPSISFSSYAGNVAFAYLDHRRKPIYPGTAVSVAPGKHGKLDVTIAGFTESVNTFSYSAGVVAIDSWTRIPAWDRSAQYNDNLFRDTIEVINENGRMIVVNHLPMEWYLKGLGEVSNGDLPEKIKTITVAARGYATYYMDRDNRKYQTQRYDGSDDPDSFQKYLGYSYERRSPHVSKMVDATAGEIIRYNGEVIKPWYFSSSNGKTLSYDEYCRARTPHHACESIPYLSSVADPAGVGRTRSGHGVGISGIGATEFARQGWDYKRIIQYYLVGVTISQ